MDTRQQLPNCMVCNEPQKYLWYGDIQGLPDINETINLDNAAWVRFQGSYGSLHDGNTYETIICDSCVTKLASEARAIFVSDMFD